MGKRKQRAPERADDAKRRQLQWNMGEQAGSSGSFIDNDAQNAAELQSARQDVKSSGSTGNLSDSTGGTSLSLTGIGSSSATGSTPDSSISTSAFAVSVDAFYQNLAFCSCTLTLNSPELHIAKDRSNLLEFGKFKVTLVADQDTTPLPKQLPAFNECWLYLSAGDARSMLYFEFERRENKSEMKKRRRSSSRQTEFGIFWFVKLNVPTTLLTDLANKSFWLGCESFDQADKSICVTVYGYNSLVLQLSHPSDPVRLKAPQFATQKLMEYFFNIQLPYCPKDQERTTGHNFFELYERVMEIHRSQLREDQDWQGEVCRVSHPCLKPRLRPYQRESVAWMLRQEQKAGNTEAGENPNGPHPLYCEVSLPGGESLYYNRYAGSFIKTRPYYLPPLPGGILADEMGLGKTVEVLCCMLLHPRPEVDQPKELPVLPESPVPSEDSHIMSTTLLKDSPEGSSVAQESCSLPAASTSSELPSAPGEEPGKEIISPLAGVSQSYGVRSTTGEDSSIKMGDGDSNLATMEQGKGAEKFVFERKGEESSILTVQTPAKMSLDCNPLLSDTSLPSRKDEEDATALSPSSPSAVQGLLDSDSAYIHSSKQLQPEVVSHTPDPFTVHIEEDISQTMDSGGSGKVEEQADQDSSSPEAARDREQQDPSREGQTQAASNNPNTTSTGKQPPAYPLASAETEQLTPSPQEEQAPSNASNKKGRKRKPRCYVEYVPWTGDTDNINTYFSIKPAKRQQWFECSCGYLEGQEGKSTHKADLHTVKCIECGMSQHAECMNYDLRDPLRGEYLCPHCHSVRTTIKSGATLIISPYSICHQWIEEIRKHIKECSIKVFIYTGVSKLGYIQPQVLARQDIVITTYDVLRKELDYANLPHTNSDSGRRFRHPKRFLATPSPMVAVEWWRICLDEAQMVECVTTKTAEMALRLKAVNRWCVTGTPLMRSVEDIYGLLLFLNVDPLRVQQWFRQLVWEPFCHGLRAPMHHALAQIFWRTAKKDVIDQIDLPMQTEEINWLTFSPVEDHFYRRQYEVYLRSVYGYRQKVQHLQDPSVKLHALDRKTMNELMSPLFRLRQACCHPQIVRGEFLPLNKTMMTMEELLEHMTKKVKTECEEAHRLIVASLNGMAGLAIIKDKVPEAVEKYREVLRSVEQNKDQFRTDDLQQLHAMHNLAQLLDAKPEGVAPTLRDSQLKEQCEELKTKYMSRTRTNVAASLEGLESCQVVIKDLKMKLDSLDGDWWAEVVDMTTQRSIDTDLLFKVKDDLVRTSTTEGSIADTFSTANGLLYVVDQHLQSLASARITLTDRLDELWRDTSPGLVQAAATCCLRPAGEVLKTCLFCKVDELFNEYESKLFLFVERGVTVAGDEGSLAYQVSTKRQGTWADSEVERTLKSILAFYRQNFDTDSDILEAAAAHIKYIEALKKEFKNLRSVWLLHREMISAIDELEMATERLRLRAEFEPRPTTKILNVIEATDMFGIQAGCSRDEIVGRNELRKKLGQLLYLTNLAKRAEQGDNCNPDMCPICQNGLGVEWSVVMCGHCFCLSCMRTLIDRTLIGINLDRRLKCPLCRFYTPVREISYVTTLKKERVNVKGSHSTKVQAVIECLIKIKQQDPTAKALVFSLWVSVLDILAAALAENKISYKSLHDPNHFQANLSAFKSDGELSVLLLPLHVGANGLNLVEANHVLLVEPELNLEEEAQAISRVYRIGQTRPTQIHRFLVRGTIEEKIYHIVKAVRGHSGEEGVELTVGDITSLIQQPGPDQTGEEEEEEDIHNAVAPRDGSGDHGGGGGGGGGPETGDNGDADSGRSTSGGGGGTGGSGTEGGDDSRSGRSSCVGTSIGGNGGESSRVNSGCDGSVDSNVRESSRVNSDCDGSVDNNVRESSRVNSGCDGSVDSNVRESSRVNSGCDGSVDNNVRESSRVNSGCDGSVDNNVRESSRVNSGCDGNVDSTGVESSRVNSGCDGSIGVSRGDDKNTVGTSNSSVVCFPSSSDGGNGESMRVSHSEDLRVSPVASSNQRESGRAVHVERSRGDGDAPSVSTSSSSSESVSCPVNRVDSDRVGGANISRDVDC